MDEQLKVFTIEEANQLIPALTSLIELLQDQQKQVMDLEAQVDALELVADPNQDQMVQELNALIAKHQAKVTEFYRIADEIQGLGCFLKDVEIGLIDFYTVIEGKVVYLCWKLGEPKVEHWHEVGKGFAYRQPLKSPTKEGSAD